jgi:hypothetical protein
VNLFGFGAPQSLWERNLSNDPRAYLDTPARIIAEDDTHVVIAMRVKKEWLAENLPLLAALADVMPSRK